MSEVEIPVGRSGRVALIDRADEELVRAYRWALLTGWTRRDGTTNYYATHVRRRRQGGLLSLVMHRLIMGCYDDEFNNSYPDLVVDHINGNGLDNRRKNLRLCTQRENTHNSRSKGNKTGVTGVQFDKSCGKYRAHIYLGCFDTPEEAGLAYRRAKEWIAGEFAL